MARRRKLAFRVPKDDEVKKDWSMLGDAAKDWLEGVITGDKFATDPYSTAYNLGREALAREILGYTRPPEPDTEIIKNVE